MNIIQIKFMYKNITLDKQSIYYMHKKYSYVKISLDKLKKLALSRHDHITFMKCDNDLVNKISSTAMETITFTVKEILKSDDWNIIYVPPKEEINLLEEELEYLLTAKNSINYVYKETMDKMIEQLVEKINEFKAFKREIKDE